MLALHASALTTRDDRALRGTSAARRGVFGDLLRWNLPIADGEFGIDRFDDQRPRCLILHGDADKHFASAPRLRASQVLTLA